MDFFDQRVHINWYPGHMKKTKELLISNLNLVDIVVEVLDSRIAYSSKNPDVDVIAKDKPRLIILNKEDLAENDITSKWIKYYKEKGYETISVSTLDNNAANKISNVINKIFEPKAKAMIEKGMNPRAIRIMIVGVPNSGKSTILNRLSGKKAAQTGDRPGVTKGKQWIRLKNNLEMLDTPGILWPKFEDEEVAKMLAFTGTIKDEVLEIEDIAYDFINYLKKINKINLINERYNINYDQNDETIDIMNGIGKARGFILKGADIDYTRTAKTILNEFRSGQLGKISLEAPLGE